MARTTVCRQCGGERLSGLPDAICMGCRDRMRPYEAPAPPAPPPNLDSLIVELLPGEILLVPAGTSLRDLDDLRRILHVEALVADGVEHPTLIRGRTGRSSTTSEPASIATRWVRAPAG